MQPVRESGNPAQAASPESMPTEGEGHEPWSQALPAPRSWVAVALAQPAFSSFVRLAAEKRELFLIWSRAGLLDDVLPRAGEWQVALVRGHLLLPGIGRKGLAEANSRGLHVSHDFFPSLLHDKCRTDLSLTPD